VIVGQERQICIRFTGVPSPYKRLSAHFPKEKLTLKPAPVNGSGHPHDDIAGMLFEGFDVEEGVCVSCAFITSF
jgi:hypothetical protein